MAEIQPTGGNIPQPTGGTGDTPKVSSTTPLPPPENVNDIPDQALVELARAGGFNLSEIPDINSGSPLDDAARDTLAFFLQQMLDKNVVNLPIPSDWGPYFADAISEILQYGENGTMSEEAMTKANNFVDNSTKLFEAAAPEDPNDLDKIKEAFADSIIPGQGFKDEYLQEFAKLTFADYDPQQHIADAGSREKIFDIATIMLVLLAYWAKQWQEQAQTNLLISKEVATSIQQQAKSLMSKANNVFGWALAGGVMSLGVGVLGGAFQLKGAQAGLSEEPEANLLQEKSPGAPSKQYLQPKAQLGEMAEAQKSTNASAKEASQNFKNFKAEVDNSHETIVDGAKTEGIDEGKIDDLELAELELETAKTPTQARAATEGYNKAAKAIDDDLAKINRLSPDAKNARTAASRINTQATKTVDSIDITDVKMTRLNKIKTGIQRNIDKSKANVAKAEEAPGKVRGTKKWLGGKVGKEDWGELGVEQQNIVASKQKINTLDGELRDLDGYSSQITDQYNDHFLNPNDQDIRGFGAYAGNMETEGKAAAEIIEDIDPKVTNIKRHTAERNHAIGGTLSAFGQSASSITGSVATMRSTVYEGGSKKQDSLQSRESGWQKNAESLMDDASQKSRNGIEALQAYWRARGEAAQTVAKNI